MSGDDPKNLGYTRTAQHGLRPTATPQPAARPDMASQPTMMATSMKL